MKIIYHGKKHASPLGVVWNVAFGLVFAFVAIKPLFGTKDVGTFGTVVAILFGGLGLYISWGAVRGHLALPIDVGVLDSGAIHIRPQSGEPIILAPTAFKSIVYSYEGSDGTLNVKADGHAWSLPVSEQEADEFMAALLTLNPQIQVDRKKIMTAG